MEFIREEHSQALVSEQNLVDQEKEKNQKLLLSYQMEIETTLEEKLSALMADTRLRGESPGDTAEIRASSEKEATPTPTSTASDGAIVYIASLKIMSPPRTQFPREICPPRTTFTRENCPLLMKNVPLSYPYVFNSEH